MPQSWSRKCTGKMLCLHIFECTLSIASVSVVNMLKNVNTFQNLMRLELLGMFINVFITKIAFVGVRISLDRF